MLPHDEAPPWVCPRMRLHTVKAPKLGCVCVCVCVLTQDKAPKDKAPKDKAPKDKAPHGKGIPWRQSYLQFDGPILG